MSDQDKLELKAADGARAIIHHHGAHVTSWMTPDGVERLFLSPRAEYAPNKAIRGGIPVIFPQFNQEGPLPRHGFARTNPWDVIEAGDGHALLQLRNTVAQFEIWPHKHITQLDVNIEGSTLETTLIVRNTDNAPFTFTCALHTYVRVDDVRQVRLDGLSGLRYADKIAGVTRNEDSETVVITQETDRIYYDVLGSLAIVEPGRSMWIKQTGFSDVVVWNPWTAAAKLADMEPEGYLQMLCVEAAAIGTPISLKAGEEWRGTQVLRAGIR